MSELLEPRDDAETRVPARPVLLREAREAAGLHIAALAAALKVPVRKLEALEAGRYDELPDLTFARALASSACRHLKVDPAPVLAQLPASPTPQLGDSRQAINAPFKSPQQAPAVNPLGWLSRPAVLGAIALLLGALVLVLLPATRPASDAADASGTPPASTAGEAPAPAVAAPLLLPVPAVPTDAGAAPTTVAPADTGATPAVAPAAPAPAADTAAATEAAPAPAAASPASEAGASGAALLAIVASDESWAEVVNGTGTVVLQRLLQPGERVEFSAAPPYAVVLGRAEAVQVRVRGRLLDTAPLVRNNVARFEVK